MRVGEGYEPIVGFNFWVKRVCLASGTYDLRSRTTVVYTRISGWLTEQSNNLMRENVKLS